ncbi:MAG: DUF3105 domain-containing protein [Nitrospirae bacterium]|nr:DUF3105 domain-containing protein [Candidatus Troglogloeales bacterium]
MDKKKSEERLKKIFTGITVAAGIGVLALLLVYAPDGKGKPDNGLARTISDTASDKTFPKKAMDTKHLDGIEFFAEEGRTHVPKETRVTYKTDPPTSGLHHDKWLPPSVYEEDKTEPELLVHNLEHGNVVIYFDPARVGELDSAALTALPKKHAGQWNGVVVVFKKGLEQPVILTAWRTRLLLKAYDADKIAAFLDAFLGRGPENPVR